MQIYKDLGDFMKKSSQTESTTPKILIRDDMSAEEVIFEVMKNLKRSFDLAAPNTPIRCNDRMFSDLRPADTKNIINKLVEEYNAIKFVTPWKSALDSPFIITLTDILVCEIQKTENFDSVFNQLSKTKWQSPSTQVLKLTYTKTQQLLLNDYFLIAELRYDSINDRIIKFLIEHPNTTFTRRELEANKVLRIEKKEDKDFFVVLDDLNISNDLRSLFFNTDLSRNSIHLRNPIYQSDLDKLGMTIVDIRPRRQK